MKSKSSMNRRTFIQSTTVAATAATTLGSALPGKNSVPAGPVIKIGLVGCGGRGTGAAENALESAPNVKIVGLADLFESQIEKTRENLSRLGQEVPRGYCFTGFDAYRKILDMDVDYVILATPPHFRPEQFTAVVEAGKHAFIEKPAAVDPVGIRMMLEAGQRAEEKGLCVVAGTQRRHAPEYIATQKRIADGAIGEIVSARGAWNQGALWYRNPRPEWDDMTYMIRDWYNWSWLSGDHVVEQHVHQIDVIHWFLGKNPVEATGFGGRHRRPTGDQFDFFNVEFVHDHGVRFFSQARQINGCANNISEFVQGTRGATNCSDTIYGPDGSVVWVYEGERVNPYVQEHTDLIRAIRTGSQINEARQVAHSTLTAIMGRLSAYSGKSVTREEALKSPLRLGPSSYGFGPVDVSREVPVPGRPAGPPREL